MTTDICDRCWGSGNATKPWANLRELQSRERDQAKVQTLADWAQRSGIGMSLFRPTIPIIVDALQALLRRRKNALNFEQQRAVEVLIGAILALLKSENKQS